MRKLIGGVMVVMTVLALSKHSSVPDTWAMQFGPERRAAGGTQHPVGPAAWQGVAQGQAQPSSLSLAPAAAHAAPVRSGSPSAITASVVQVVDGDTITVRIGGRTETVRYIGVEAMGPTAADINRRLLASGEVRLELDLQDRDRAGRLLAYVHAGDIMANAELVAEGVARVADDSPNARHRELLRDLERQAQILKVGMWRSRGARN
jgi:endonuclease YncB( thermonuclease family)